MPFSASHRDSFLSVEPLEERQMLSTVAIDAVGTTGEEILVVTANGSELFSSVVSASGSELSFEVDDSLAVADLQINFVNDLFEPGVVDRNLTVQELRFNGNRFDPSADNVFSTGTYLAEDGVVSGFGRGNILHSNGFFQVAPSDEISFNGNVWNTSRSVSGQEVQFDSVNNELVLSGISGEDLALSRQVDIEPGSLAVLTVDAWRNVISGSIGNNAAAGAGIDFFDADGNEVFAFDNVDFQLNENATDPSDRVQSNQFRIPDNATSAFLWVWVQGSDQGTNVPLRLTDLRLEPGSVSGDTQPPTARISSVSALNDNFFIFSISFEDDVALPADPNVIPSNVGLEVIDPDGRVITPTFDSTTQFGATLQSITYLINGDSVGAPDLLVSGAYEVRLIDGLIDAAGNVAPAQSLGNLGPFTV